MSGGCRGPQLLVGKQAPGVPLRSQRLNPCLVMAAFSLLFLRASLSSDRKKSDVTKTRKEKFV